MQRLRAAHLAGQGDRRKELSKVERRIREIVAAIADGFRSEALRDELAALEQRRVELRAADAPVVLPKLQPNLAHLFREKVSRLTELLTGAPADSVRQALREFIERIVIPPDGMLRVIGNTAALGLDTGDMVGCGGGI